MLSVVSGNLREALALRKRELAAVVGGGGKTTFMFALAEELRETGRRVLLSTTTKVWHKEARRAQGVILAAGDGWHQALLHGLEKRGEMFLGKGLLENGKVEGMPPELIDGLFRNPKVDYLIVEADGSAGRPVKAPADHEPVIPASASLVVALMGLEALGRPATEDVVFRLDRFAAATGTKSSETLTPASLSRVFLADAGVFKGSPPDARRVVLLNKLDAVASESDARDLCREILDGAEGRIERVVMASIKEKIFHIFTRRRG